MVMYRYYSPYLEGEDLEESLEPVMGQENGEDGQVLQRDLHSLGGDEQADRQTVKSIHEKARREVMGSQ